MNQAVLLLCAVGLGFGGAFLLRDGPRSDADPAFGSAIDELRVEVARLRAQLAERPALAAGRPPPAELVDRGPARDGEVRPASPARDLVPEHVRRESPDTPLPRRTEEDSDLLRRFTPRHDDEAAHEQTLRRWLFVGEQVFLRRFGPPDEIRWSDGAEIWVYEGLFAHDPGVEVNLRFRAGRFVGVY